jgi:hypothetical protein
MDMTSYVILSRRYSLSRSISGKAKDPLMIDETDPPKESGQAFQRLGDVALVSVNGNEEEANACPAELREISHIPEMLPSSA